MNDAGEFTSEAGPDLEGLSVLGEGNLKCIEKLKASGALVKVHPTRHTHTHSARLTHSPECIQNASDCTLLTVLRVHCELQVEDYVHKYPYDWRSKKPTIFRATSQWFASVDGFRADALSAIDSVKWMPEIGRNRITAMTQSRSDWCISRQRTWGVPIPVFYHKVRSPPSMPFHALPRPCLTLPIFSITPGHCGGVAE